MRLPSLRVQETEVHDRVRTHPGGVTLLKDVAHAAGISISGVSRALNGDRKMSARTRERIKKLAANMGYKPVAAARSLRDFARTRMEVPFQGTIAHLIYPHEARMMAERDARSRHAWIFEVENRAQSHGYSLDIIRMEESGSSGQIKRMLYARGIRAVLISAKHNDLRVLDLDWNNIAAVSLSADPTVRFLTNLSVPYFQDTHSAVHEVFKRGYRRVGFVMVGNVLEEFLAGYQTAVHKLGLPVFNPLVSLTGVPRELKSWIRRNRLDCIVTTTGIELLEGIRHAGFDVPRDIGLCCIDDFDAPGVLSGLHQPRVKLAALAVDILHTMIQRNEFSLPEYPMEIHLPSQWSDGQTLRPIQS